jgi:F0F1-type ATP synthase alpha subunit
VTVFERQFLEFLRQKRQALRQAITIQRELSEQIESMLVDAITDFKQHDMVLGD